MTVPCQLNEEVAVDVKKRRREVAPQTIYIGGVKNEYS